MSVNKSKVFSFVTVSSFYMMLLLFSTSYFLQEATSGAMLDQLTILR